MAQPREMKDGETAAPDWPALFALAEEIFGCGNKARQEFTKIFDELDPSQTGEDPLTGAARQGDICYFLTLTYRDGAPVFNGLRIMNGAAYENSNRRAMTAITSNYGQPPTVTLEGDQLSTMASGHPYVKVLGTIENITPAGPDHPYGYQKALLRSGGNAITVMLRNQAFTEEELSCEREHLLWLESGLSVPLVWCSPLADDD